MSWRAQTVRQYIMLLRCVDRYVQSSGRGGRACVASWGAKRLHSNPNLDMRHITPPGLNHDIMGRTEQRRRSCALSWLPGHGHDCHLNGPRGFTDVLACADGTSIYHAFPVSTDMSSLSVGAHAILSLIHESQRGLVVYHRICAR